MFLSLLVVVIGFAAVLSGVIEQNIIFIAVGVVLMIGAWLVFRRQWQKRIAQNNKKDL